MSAMGWLDRSRVVDCARDAPQSSTDLLDSQVLRYSQAEACFRKSEAAVRLSKLMIDRSDKLIRQLGRGLVQSAAGNKLAGAGSPVSASENGAAKR